MPYGKKSSATLGIIDAKRHGNDPDVIEWVNLFRLEAEGSCSACRFALPHRPT